MAVQQLAGVGAGIATGEALTRAHEDGLVGTGTIAVAAGGIGAGLFGPLIVNQLAEEDPFPVRGAQTFAGAGLAAYWWAVARMFGYAPRISVAPPEEVNVAEAVVRGTLTGLTTAGIVLLLPSADRIL